MTQRSATGRTARCAFAVAATVLATGCSALGSDPAPAPSSDASSGQPVSSAPAVSPSAPASASPTVGRSPTAVDPPASSEPGQALASRDFSAKASTKRISVRFDVVELKRRGELLDLTRP